MRGPDRRTLTLSILAVLFAGCEEAPPTVTERGVTGRGVGAAPAVPEEEAEGPSRSRREEPSREPALRSASPRTAAAVALVDAGASAPSRNEALVRTVESCAAPVVSCLSEHGGGGAEASVAVDFEISGTGRVTRAEVAADAHSPLESCVRRAAEAIRFPEGEATRFRYEYRARR